MSMPTPIKVTCPKCGEEADFTIWRSLNSDVSSHMMEKFLSGEIFAFTCPVCGETTRVNYPMLYHDMTNALMVSYAQAGDEAFQKDMLEQSKFFLNMGYKYRIVYDDRALIEKALIFREGFDDRTIELLKFIISQNITREYPEANIEKSYFIKDGDAYKLIFIGNLTLESVLTKEAVDKAHEDFSKHYTNNEYIIDTNWAMNFFNMLTSDSPRE